MSETVFILGAGASKEAGAPLMAEFLDVADRLRTDSDLTDMASDFHLVFKAIAALRPAYSHAKIDLADNVEAVFAAFEMAKLLGRLGTLSKEEIDRLPGAMRQVIIKTLEKTILFPVSNRRVPPPIPYESFSEVVRELADFRLKKYGNVTVITFNYDLCLDYAFHWSNILVSYCLRKDSEPGIKLLKLHGSLNWVRCPGCNDVVPWHIGNFFQGRDWRFLDDQTKTVELGISKHLRNFKHCGNIPAKEPFIIPPTWNKTQHHQQIDNVWSAAATELVDAKNIFVCGYSLPSTDQFFRYLYALGTIGEGRLKRFFVFDPDTTGDVKSRFRDIVGPAVENRFEFFNSDFKSAITTIRSRLGMKW